MKFWANTKLWFQQAVDKYQRPLTRYARGILRNLEPAREVVQESFLRLWKNGEVESGNPLRIWLYRTTRNLAIDHLRKEGRMESLSENDEEQLPCPEQMPSEALEKKQASKNIMSEVDSLPAKYQEVLRLKFQEELSYKEISEVTGHSVSHVGVLLHTAILNLRQSLAQSGGRNEG